MLLFLATFVGIILMFPLIDFEIDNWEDKLSNKYGQLCCDQDFFFFFSFFSLSTMLEGQWRRSDFSG